MTSLWDHALVRENVASRDYRCDGYPYEEVDERGYVTSHKPCPGIKKGKRYRRIALPPSMDYEADVDDEGRTVGIFVGERWTVIRVCEDCQPPF